VRLVMDGGGYICELCLALEHQWRPDELFVIFTSYFDEADTHGPEPTLIMAGYVGHAYQWKQFEKKLSRIQQRLGFKIFHARDFKSRSREFSGWSDDKCDQLIMELSSLVKELTQGFSTALSYDRFINEYRSPPIPKKLNLDSQYGACFRICLAHLLKLMRERGNRDHLHVVIERGHPRVGDCERIFNDIKSRERRLGSQVFGSFTIENKADCYPLMVADLLAAAHSMMRSRIKSGTLDRESIILPSDAPSVVKGAIAVLDAAPNALKNLKIAFEQDRQREVDEWRARRAAKNSLVSEPSP
jgi:hypothetical protein